MAAINGLRSYFEQTGEEPLAPLANEADVEQFFAMQPELTEERPPFPLSPVRDYTRFLTGPAAKPAAKATKAVIAPKPSFEIMEPGTSPFGLQENRKDLQFALGGGPSLDFLKGRAGVAAQAEQEKQRFVARAGQEGGEPAKTPVPARTADATTGTTISGDVAQKAPATDDGKAAEPVVAAGAPSVGAGGDEGIDRTALAEALARGGEAIFRGVTGRALPTGIPEMLAAVRQRREAQAQREREIGAERGRQEQLFQQQRGLKAMEIEAEQAKTERARQFAEADVGRQIDYLKAQALSRGDEAKAERLEGLRGMAAKGSDVRALLKSEYDEDIARAGAEAKTAGAELARERVRYVGPLAEATIKGREAAAEAARASAEKTRIDAAETLRKQATVALQDVKGPLADPKLEQKRVSDFNKFTTGSNKTHIDPLRELAGIDKDFEGIISSGKAPSWLDRKAIAEIQSGTATDPTIVTFAAKYNDLINRLRNALFGASLTASEQKAFGNQIELSLIRGGDAFAQQLRALADSLKNKTKNQLGFTIGRNPDLAQNWLQTTGLGDDLAGTYFADTFSKAFTGKPAKAAEAPEVPSIRIRQKGGTEVRRFSREDADRLLSSGDYEEAP